jgi:hypothetical protein
MYGLVISKTIFNDDIMKRGGQDIKSKKKPKKTLIENPN